MSGAVDLSADPSTWETWWEFNRSSFVDLRRAVHDSGPSSGDVAARVSDRLRPGEAELRGRVIPALLEELEKSRNPDLATGSIVALAKIGLDTRLSSEMVRFLREPNQEVSETAALCLGLLRDERALSALVALASDQPSGLSFVGKESLPQRTRVFAVYALGVYGSETVDEKARIRVVEALRKLPAGDGWDLGVARVLALGLVRDEDRAGAEDLRRILENPGADPRVRACVPISLARLLGSEDRVSHPLRPWLRERLLGILADRKAPVLLRASCAQALPYFVDSNAAGAAPVVEPLATLMSEGRSQAERQFAAIALGRVGGPEAEQLLLKQLGKAGSLRPWAALALGILGRSSPASVPTLGPKIRERLASERNPSYVGAYAIALGLMRDEASSDLLLGRVADGGANPDVRSFCAVALGMLGARHAIPEIQALVRSSIRHPLQQQQAVIALGLLGDKTVALELTALLAEAKTLSAQSALASAVGRIGDGRTLDPLLSLMRREGLSPLSKAFVAVALGMVGEREDLSWSARLSKDLNYFAAPRTLVDRANLAGVLDIL